MDKLYHPGRRQMMSKVWYETTTMGNGQSHSQDFKLNWFDSNQLQSFMGGVYYKRGWFEDCNVTCLVPGFWLNGTTTFSATRGKTACMRKTRLNRIEKSCRGVVVRRSPVAGLATKISIRSDTNSRGCGRTSKRPRNPTKQDELAALGTEFSRLCRQTVGSQTAKPRRCFDCPDDKRMMGSMSRCFGVDRQHQRSGRRAGS
jgi:hypothetical protein